MTKKEEIVVTPCTHNYKFKCDSCKSRIGTTVNCKECTEYFHSELEYCTVIDGIHRKVKLDLAQPHIRRK